MKSPPVLLLFGALLAAVGALAAGCGDGDDGAPTVEEYFQQLEALVGETDQQINDAYLEYLDGSSPQSPEEEQVAAGRKYFEGEKDALQSFADGLSDTNPPVEAAEAHEALAEAMVQLVGAFEATVSDLADASSVAEMYEIFSNHSGSLLLNDACVELVSRAAAADSSLLLTCEEGTIALACAEEDTETALQEYLLSVQAAGEPIDARFKQEGALGFPQFSYDLLSGAISPEMAASGVADFLESVKDVDPPCEVEPTHATIMDSGGDYLALLEELSTADPGDIASSFDESGDGGEAAFFFAAAIHELEHIANDHGLEFADYTGLD